MVLLGMSKSLDKIASQLRHHTGIFGGTIGDTIRKNKIYFNAIYSKYTIMDIKIWNSSELSVPTVFIHSFIGNGEDVWKACKELDCPPFNLVSIYNFDFDGDLTPWEADNIRKGQPPFRGNASCHLQELVSQIIPYVDSQLSSPSSYHAMAGYSLAGLFTFWSMWNTDIFKKVACISSSFWYPGLLDFMESKPLLNRPECIYFSLGDKESKTKHPLMKMVEERTKQVVLHTKELNIPIKFEMNPGNHFTDSDKRTAKGIQWILQH